MLKRIFRYPHTNWALADQAMVSGVNFLTGIILARYLGLEEYGRFTLAWMAILLCNSFQHAGIIAPMMSIGPKQRQTDRTCYYGTVFIHQLLWSSICFLVIWFSAYFSGLFFPEWRLDEIALPLAAVLFTWQFQDFIRRYFFVTDKFGHAFLNDVISYLTQLCLLLFLFSIIPLDSSMVLWVISGTSAFAILIALLNIGAIETNRHMFKTITKKHWQFSRWMLASAMMQWFSGNFYLVVAGSLLGPVAVGGVKAAQNIMGVTHILFQSMENFAPSNAARELSARGVPALKAYLRKLTFAGVSATAAVALIAFSIPAVLLSLLYGKTFGEYAYVLRWFCVIYVFGFLVMPVTTGLRTVEKTKPLFYSVFFAGIFSLISAYPLILLFRLHGLMAGLLCVKVGMVLYLYHTFNKSYSKE